MGEMQDQSDAQLLRAFATRADEVAFREIVTRHTDFVYSAALRQVESTAIASDLAQSVFTDLARKAQPLAEKITGDSSLAGWLHRSTRYAALNHLRDSRRRRDNERLAMEQLLTDSDSAADWEKIRPALDEAMDALEDIDREAVLLRYFKNQDFHTVGQQLGVSDDAAQKRVRRAVERLREFFAKRGVSVGAGGLVVVISANAVQAAPVGLAVTISAAALAGTAATTSTLIAATTKTIAMTTLQKTLVTATVAVLAGAGLYEARQAAQLRDQVQTLQQQQAPLAEQVDKLQNRFADATNRLADLLTENARLKSNPNQSELLKLRGEVTRLKAATNDLPDAVTKQWLNKIVILKQSLKDMPDKAIPELQFLTEKDWGNAAWGADLDSEDGIRQALGKLREEAQNIFLNEMMKGAINKYLVAHDGLLPADLFQLKPYFDVPVSDATLQRYALVQSGKPDRNEKLVETTAAPVDDEYDSYHEISLNGAGGAGVNLVSQQVSAAMIAFGQANNGQKPTEANQLLPLLKQPIDPIKIQKYLDKFAASSNRFLW